MQLSYFLNIICGTWYHKNALHTSSQCNLVEFVLDFTCLSDSDRVCFSFSSDTSVLGERLCFRILSPAFNFIWFGLVTDLCVSAELPLKASIACNLTYAILALPVKVKVYAGH